MSRNHELFPDDENGDILWNMGQDGDNLSVPREIDFSVIFPTEDAATKFAVLLLKNDQKVSLSPYVANKKFPWQVQAHPMMLPTHGNVSNYEKQLGDDASKFGGRNDGWGCFAQS
jgi:Regulator of ribonuclease activity B